MYCVCVLGVCWVCVCVGCVCRASACWVGVSTPFCLFCLSSSPACLPPNSTAVVLLYFPKQQITLLSVMQIRIRIIVGLSDPDPGGTMTGRVQEYRQNRCLFDLLSVVVDFLVIQIIFFPLHFS